MFENAHSGRRVGVAYYNEIDPFAAQWLRNLISAGLIAPGDVDERDIRDVRPDDLAGYTQCHFFAGIGVWSHALRRAGWPDSRPVWTGSCPCQPFSVCGVGGGFNDERHLWPFFHHLIAQRRPATVFGEQVASKDGLHWLDLVHSDMEGTGYAFAAVDLCSAGVGAPHIRQRLWFVADANDDGLQGRTEQTVCGKGRGQEGDAAGCSGTPLVEPVGVEHAVLVGRQRRQEAAPGHVDDGQTPERSQGEHGLGVASAHRVHRHGTSPTNGHWRDADWLLCRDGKWRPVEPGTFPLAHGVTGRVGRLRAYGNAIVAEAASQVIGARLDTEAML